MRELSAITYNLFPPRRRERAARGMTLIEVVVAIAFVTVAFVSLYGLYRASVRFVATAKAREAALSLAVERLEALRAMQYSQLGTLGGIPAGAIAQNEAVLLDGISFSRRTFIQYVDDPADGTGSGDANGIAADYKRAKVAVTWATQAGTSSVELVSNFIPVGIENTSGGGTLSLMVFNALAQAVPDAMVRIINNTGTSTVDVTTYTNAAGVVQFPGTLAMTGYQITVSKPGYSGAQTYAANAQNPNPDPGHLSVVTNQTTSGSFSIDLLASLTLRTWEPILPATTTDTFANSSAIASTSNATVADGAVSLSGSYEQSGAVYSTAVAPQHLASWGALSWSATVPAETAVRVALYTQSGGIFTPVPDSALPGNSGGFAASPVSLAGVSTTTYPSLALGAVLTGPGTETPRLLDWSLSYSRGPTPLPSASFTMQGAKTIGTTGTGAAIYKMQSALTSDSSAQYVNGAVEWDTYTFSVASSTGWDLASLCPFQPVSIAPGTSAEVDLHLVAHTQNSLQVSVRSVTSSAAIPGASVTLSRTGFSSTKNADTCGQTFFSGLSAGSTYSLAVSAAGYTSTTTNNVNVSKQSTALISL